MKLSTPSDVSGASAQSNRQANGAVSLPPEASFVKPGEKPPQSTDRKPSVRTSTLADLLSRPQNGGISSASSPSQTDDEANPFAENVRGARTEFYAGAQRNPEGITSNTPKSDGHLNTDSDRISSGKGCEENLWREAHSYAHRVRQDANRQVWDQTLSAHNKESELHHNFFKTQHDDKLKQMEKFIEDIIKNNERNIQNLMNKASA